MLTRQIMKTLALGALALALAACVSSRGLKPSGQVLDAGGLRTAVSYTHLTLPTNSRV